MPTILHRELGPSRPAWSRLTLNTRWPIERRVTRKSVAPVSRPMGGQVSGPGVRAMASAAFSFGSRLASSDMTGRASERRPTVLWFELRTNLLASSSFGSGSTRRTLGFRHGTGARPNRPIRVPDSWGACSWARTRAPRGNGELPRRFAVLPRGMNRLSGGAHPRFEDVSPR